jgi:SAM-dependent methyltransferase
VSATLTSYQRERVYQDGHRRELQRQLDELFSSQPLRRVIDVGCGFESPLDFPSSVHVVGLDVSAEALERNMNVDEKLVGDVQTYPLPAESFDAAVCWDMLEHLADPFAALRNIERAVRPGGALIVGIPNLWSMKGLATRITPFGFHVWVYRHVFGYERAGEPGNAPFRTYLRITPAALLRWSSTHGLDLVHADIYSTRSEDKLPRPLRLAWKGLCWAGSVASVGRWNPRLTEALLLFRKVSAPSAG